MRLFPTEDIIYLHGLLDQPHEFGGQILVNWPRRLPIHKRNNTELFKLIQRRKGSHGHVKEPPLFSVKGNTVTRGKADGISLRVTPYNFHTHPKYIYKRSDHRTFAGWFSGLDMEYIVGNITAGLQAHLLITPEGLYVLGVTEAFASLFVELPLRCQESIIQGVKKTFSKLEKERISPKNILTLNEHTIKILDNFLFYLENFNGLSMSGSHRSVMKKKCATNKKILFETPIFHLVFLGWDEV